MDATNRFLNCFSFFVAIEICQLDKMNTASLQEMKKKMGEYDKKDLIALCLRLSKYKKENKELLAYLLFDSQDEETYRTSVKETMDEQFLDFPRYNAYLVGKGLRKILRGVNKYIRFSGSRQTEVELLLYFLQKMKKAGIRYQSSASLFKIYEMQVKKIEKAIGFLHEDLQYDYKEELKTVR